MGPIYAGHIGSFFAPSIYSTHLINSVDSSSNWRNGHNVSIVLRSRNSGQFTYEKPSSYFEGIWYPSKMIVIKTYDSSEGIYVKLTGKKMAIPKSRAYALKLEAEYNGKEGNLNILFLPRNPRVRNLKNWDPSKGVGNTWLWKPPPTEDRSGRTYFDSANGLLIFENIPQKVYIAFGLNKPIQSWETNNAALQITEQFRIMEK